MAYQTTNEDGDPIERRESAGLDYLEALNYVQWYIEDARKEGYRMVRHTPKERRRCTFWTGKHDEMPPVEIHIYLSDLPKN